MRRSFILFAVLVVVFAQLGSMSARAATGPAPADEYFGRHKVSILEIRNRLNAYDAKSDSEMLHPDVVIGIDDVQNAILDWQSKYPNDSWLPRSFLGLLRAYKRAGAASSPEATVALNIMRTAYPDAEETGTAVALVFGGEGNAIIARAAETVRPSHARASNDPWARYNSLRGPRRVRVAGVVVDASTGEPIPGAVVFVAPENEASDASSTPFAATKGDGSFVVRDVQLGSAYTQGSVAYSHAEYIVVRPPHGSGYAAYHGIINASSPTISAGVIRLSAP